MQAKALKIYTIGHSNLPEEAFVALLHGHGVGMVVDVRSAPFSRFAPHFNRRALPALLGRHGIAYAWAGDRLGGRPDDADCYKDGVVPDGHADYLKLVDYQTVAEKPWFREGIDRLLDLADGRSVAVMCSEEDPERCHRHHLIAQALLGMDVDVRHIRRDGSAAPAPRETPVEQPALF
jgi:uncharacterized protein (DUF488 family)